MTVSFGAALRVWFRLGCISFGGPIAQIDLMHREVVEDKPAQPLDATRLGGENVLNVFRQQPGSHGKRSKGAKNGRWRGVWRKSAHYRSLAARQPRKK